MDLTKGDMLIISGEGDGPGTIERYEGARTAPAIRKRLSRERAGGDRWAWAWIELKGREDDALPGAAVYGKLGRDLNEIIDQREIDEADIEINPAAQLAAGRRSPASAANGAKGGRPRKIIYNWRMFFKNPDGAVSILDAKSDSYESLQVLFASEIEKRGLGDDACWVETL